MKNKILLYNSGGGLGDSIQLFTLILSLKNHFKESDFFYLGAHDNHYENKLNDYNIKIKTLDLGLKYFGFRWWHLLKVKKQILKKNIDKFDLIIDLQTKLRNSLILKLIPTKNFYSATYKFSFCTIKNKYTNKENISEMTLSNEHAMPYKPCHTMVHASGTRGARYRIPCMQPTRSEMSIPCSSSRDTRLSTPQAQEVPATPFHATN